jgi:hypothetical protein
MGPDEARRDAMQHVNATGREIETGIVNLALGRIFLLMSRPFQPGDVEEYERCRRIVMDHSGGDCAAPYAPNYVAQRLMGAQGD